MEWRRGNPAAPPPINLKAWKDTFKVVEVASVADAIEQLYGMKNYMYPDVRPLFKTKFAGRAVTVSMTKYENKEGVTPTAPMVEAIDTSPVGSVFVMAVEDGVRYGVIGGLMGTTLKFCVKSRMISPPKIQRLSMCLRMVFLDSSSRIRCSRNG